MILAGHFPTMRFDHAQWETMPVYEKEKGMLADPGYHRTSDDRGKPLVFYAPGFEDDRPHFVVRPIVRVPMRKRAVDRIELMLADLSAWARLPHG